MQDILAARKVKHLYHFTRAENLENILRYGLMPRETLDILEIDSHYNDEFRLENRLDAVCLSVEFPNYKMFYKLRQGERNASWAVLCLDVAVLHDFSCAYCWTNAADASVSVRPTAQRECAEAFEALFCDRVGYPKRETLGIPEYYPTNPQAEVLVFGTIPVHYIREICFEDYGTLSRYQDVLPGRRLAKVNWGLFRPRIDWKNWQ